MAKQEYPHFNPTKYDLQVKISVVKTSSHCKNNINYHIIFIPKYRKRILVGEVVDVLKSIIQGQCEELGLEMLALEVMPDHIHLFVSANPTHKPCEIVQKIKENIENVNLSLFISSQIRSDNPLGYSLSLDRNNRMIYINGRYRYFNEKEWNTLMKHLKEFLKDETI